MNNNVYNLLSIFVPAAMSLVAVLWIYFKMLRIAHEKGLVDNPDARKLQKQPIPVVGGLSVFFGVISAVLLGSCMMSCTHLVPILTAMSVMVFLGAMDDILGLSPGVRFLIEVMVVVAMIYGGGGCIDSLHGLWGIENFSWWIGVPLTIVAGVGIINAINMIDGVNGLSSGICVTCCCLFAYAFYRGKDYPNAMLCMSMATGLIPFLVHNVIGKKSKMFIGDAGTMAMGALMAWCVMQVLRSDSSANWLAYEHQGLSIVALTLAILSVPVFDTVRVMLMRMANGKSPFSPDRNHLHHIIYDYGKSHSLTSILEITIDLIVCAAFAIAYSLECSIDVQFYAVVVAALILVWGMFYFLRRNYRLDTRLAYRMRKTLKGARQGEKSWWMRLQKWIDTPRGIFDPKEEDEEMQAPLRRRK